MPKKKVTEEQLDEIECKKEWCLTILDFMLKNSNNPLIGQMKEIVIETYNNLDLKGMKYCYNDINEWAKGLSISEVKELDDLLKQKIGIGFKKTENENDILINSILKNGRISNEDEYSFILNYIDMVDNKENKKEEINLLNKLLLSYPL